jgi:hypothetical protein
MMLIINDLVVVVAVAVVVVHVVVHVVVVFVFVIDLLSNDHNDLMSNMI